MSKVFITGIAGFLGSHLADAFLADGHEVSGCDNLLGGYKDNVPSGAKFFQYDCGDWKLMQEATKNIDIVYHCAATAYEGLSVFSPNMICQNVYQNSIALISAAIANKVKRFIFCSSMARYGAQKVPFTEDMIPMPEDPYGIAKYAAELTLEKLAKVHGIEYVIAVPHNIIGPRQKYDDPFRNVASIMINLMLQNKQPIIYGDGEQKRCFSFVQDCISSLKKMAFENNVVGEIINIGPDEEFVSINQLFEIIARLLDFQKKPIYMSSRPCEVKLASCSAAKARKLLGYKTQFTLEQGLKEMIKNIEIKGVKPFEYHIDLEIINEKTPKTWSEKLF